MTDSADPTGPSRRKKREPATLDLSATAVEDGRRDERTAAEAERREAETAAPAAEPTGASGGPLPAGPDAPEPARGAGFGGLLAAALLGGIVGAGLLFGIGQWRAGPGPDARLAALEQRLSALPGQAAVRAVESRLAALESAQASLAARAAAAQAAADGAAARAEEALARPPAPAAPAADGPAAAELAQRLGRVETEAGSAAGRAAAAVEDLQQRLAGQEQRLAGQEQRLAGQEQRVAAQDAAARNFGERVAAQDVAARGFEERLVTLDRRLADLARQVAEAGSETTKAGTRVVLADRLADSLRDGAPYAETLAALQRLGTGAGALAPLEPFARTGAPTVAALSDGFRDLGERIVRDSQPASDSWSDRLSRMAERIVTIRAVDDRNATSVPALVARIGAALNRGSVGDAAAAFAALPEPARAAAGEWGLRLQQRAAAEAAAQAVAAEAVAALTPATR